MNKPTNILYMVERAFMDMAQLSPEDNADVRSRIMARMISDEVKSWRWLHPSNIWFTISKKKVNGNAYWSLRLGQKYTSHLGRADQEIDYPLLLEKSNALLAASGAISASVN